MFSVTFIGIALAFIIFKLWGCTYDDIHLIRGEKKFDEKDKLKRPLWAVILLAIISIIPIVNVIILVIIFFIYFRLLFNSDLFFHSDSKIFNWLNKNI